MVRDTKSLTFTFKNIQSVTVPYKKCASCVSPNRYVKAEERKIVINGDRHLHNKTPVVEKQDNFPLGSAEWLFYLIESVCNGFIFVVVWLRKVI